MTMPPWCVGLVIGFLLIVPTYTYFFQIPATLRAKSTGRGHWGEPDGEFNWCELDYQLTTLVAEPMNTATGALYMLVAGGAFQLHRFELHLETRLLLIVAVIAAVGVGTVLFHATLRYPMQLLDELPLFYMNLLGAWFLRERRQHLRHGFWLPAVICTFALVVTVVLQATHQQSSLHQVFRGIMSTTFSICFVYIFWAAASCAAENRPMQELFFRAFGWFVVSILCWLVDNTACELLQALRWYPNFHALGWHCGTVVGLYLFFLALLVQRQEVHGVKCEVQYIGRLPVVRPIKAKSS